MDAQGQVWFDNGPPALVLDRQDEIERAVLNARTEGAPFITLRGTDGETWRVNPNHIRRIGGPPTEPGPAAGIKNHPWS
jgi:hypothetical protein